MNSVKVPSRLRAPARPRISLEGLLTHPDCFGLETATAPQRAFCRCIDGLPLGTLANDPDVQWCFGGEEAIRRLPVGRRPTEVDLVAGVRIGKTLLSSTIAFQAALTCDLTGIRIGEEPVYSIMALNLDNARVAINHLIGTVPNRRLLRPHFLSARKYSITIKHAATGRPIEIRAVAGKRAGSQLASRWSCGLSLDEFGKMLGQDEGVVNYDDCVRVIRPRLRGHQIFAPGSPWAPRGPAFKAVTDHWGKPTAERVVIRCTGPMANPFLYTPAFVEEMRRAVNGELTVQTEVMAEFGDLPTQFFTGEDIRRCTRPAPALLRVPVDPVALATPFDDRRAYAAFIDPAARGNAWTLVIVSYVAGDTDSSSVFEVALAAEWVGSKQNPLNPKDTFARMKPYLERYLVTEVWSDHWSFDANRVIASEFGIDLVLDDASQQEKDDRYLALRELVVSDAPPDAGQAKRISFPADPVFRQDMLAIVKELTRRGLAFPLPITSDGRHADYAPSTVGAVAKAREASAGWMAHMKRARAGGHLGATGAEIDRELSVLERRMLVGR